MSVEASHDKEDLAALDSLLQKYGSSSATEQKKNQLHSEGALSADVPQAPTKSFLQEIQERAQIISCQRERSVKHTLHTVVAQQPVEQTEGNLDDIVRLIRGAP
ncbi:uncharacterized protein [Amphiura filiformis]|uniref:uncharacterized protein n=1 Tax=Amphiura filiformis TaxID=82378 RepID=UPI003B20D085